MNKKAMLLASALLLGLPAANAAALSSSDFSDLGDLNAATKAKLDALISAGVFNGMSDGTFGLKEEMNRAQFAKVAALIFGLQVDTSLQTSTFKDVKADDPGNGYALPYIEALKQSGIVQGVGGDRFDPSGEVTKEQLAAFLIRGLGADTKLPGGSTPSIPDPSVSDWASAYVQQALQLKLLSAGANGQFEGKQAATRDLLASGAYETKKQFEAEHPVAVTGAEFASGNRLLITLSGQIDESSVDLAKITVNGAPLDPTKDKFALSEDKKTIVVTLREGYALDTSKTPAIEVGGVKTLFGNEVKKGGEPIPVTVTEKPAAPAVPPASSTSTAPATPSDPEPDAVVTIDRAGGQIERYSAQFNVSASVTGTVYYGVYPDNGQVSPGPGDIRDGKGAVAYGRLAAGMNPAAIQLTNLTPDTAYALFAFEATASGRESAVVSAAFRTLPAEESQLPPTISFNQYGTSRAEAAGGGNVLTVSMNTDGVDKLYYMLLPYGAPAPSREQVIAQDPGQVQEAYYGTIDASAMPPTVIRIEQLLENVSYKLYIVGTGVRGTTEMKECVSLAGDFASFEFALGIEANAGSAVITPEHAPSGEYRLYYMVYAASDGAPAPEIPPADALINFPSGIKTLTGDQSFEYGPLESGKTYYVYGVIVDGDQTSYVASGSFTAP